MGYGKRSKKRFWRYWRLRILLAVLLFVGGTGLVVLLSPKKNISPLRSDPTTYTAPKNIKAESGILTLKDVLHHHFEATGGYDRQKQLQSFQMMGSMEINGEDYPITIIKKAPNLSRTTIRFANAEYTIGYDGKKVWSQRNPSNAAPEIAEVTGDEAYVYKQDSNIHSRLFYYQDSDIKFELLPDKEMVGEHLCYVVKSSPKSGEEYTHYIDSNVFLERKVTQTRHGITEEVIYTRHRQFDGITVPAEIKIFRDGVMTSKLNIDNVYFNRGIVLSIFKMPSQDSNS